MSDSRDDRLDRRQFIRGGAAAVAALGLGGALIRCGDATAPAAPDAAALDAGADLGGADLALDAGADQGAAAAADAAVDAAPPAKRPDTTVRQRIQGVLATEKQPTSKKQQWGVTQLVAGDPHKRTDLLKVDATAQTPTGPPVSLFYAAQLTDIHVIDEESPARTINLDAVASPAWRHQEAYTGLVLDAMVRKLHKLHALRPLDCALLTGDFIDNNQKNELEWFLQVLEGKAVTPNSGALEDPVSGADNDPHDAFTAKGLGSIPWYAAIGNHDSLIQGNLAHSPFASYSLITGDPTRDSVGKLDLGRVNGPICNTIPSDEAQLPARCIPTVPSQLSNGSLTADKQRAHLTKKEWIQGVLMAGGLPSGHGFDNKHAVSGEGDYTADPVSGLPLRLIVLDTTASVGALGYYSRVDSFLVPALKQAQADGVLVIVVSHHYSSGIPLQASKLRQALNSFPNVVAHIVGHGHKNSVTARPGASPAHGYWEVQTSGLVEWPQQGRLFELVDNRDGTAELWLTLVDYDTDHLPGGALVEASRFLSLYEIHSGTGGGGTTAEGDVGDRNVILPVAVPADVQKKLALLPGMPIESKLFA